MLVGGPVNPGEVRGYQNAGQACAFNSVLQLIGASHGPDTIWQLNAEGEASDLEVQLAELLNPARPAEMTGSAFAKHVPKLAATTQDPIVVMGRLLEDKGEWAESVSFNDRHSRQRQRFLRVQPTERVGLAERLADVSNPGQDLFVAITIGHGVVLKVDRTYLIDGLLFVLSGVVVFERRGATLNDPMNHATAFVNPTGRQWVM
jgi:hypothetical protein